MPLAAALQLLLAAPAGAAPADTWNLLSTAPAGSGADGLFALTVDPNNASNVLYATPSGQIYRSLDTGANWKKVAQGLGQGVLVLAFDPIEPTHVLVGTRGGGIWRSDDSGGSWRSLDHGTETVRAFAFSVGLSAAATDGGVLITHDGDTWQPAALQHANVAAVAVAGGKIFAGADLDRSVQGLPLFMSSDSGVTWTKLAGPASGGAIVSSLAVQGGKLLVGTNAGLFASPDGGTSWSGLANGALPQTDYTALRTTDSKLFVASDGGAATTGGLWESSDGGQSFRSLDSPVPSVTALAVSGSTVFAATFRSADHAVFIWSYVDQGGAPQQPAAGVVPAPNAAAAAPVAPSSKPLTSEWLQALVHGPELPFLALGVAAVLVLFLALVAYARKGRVS
ncbi:MAG TPA: hypothetical protein VF137_07245 [Candidatus Dormibacteraeota bacterium]